MELTEMIDLIRAGVWVRNPDSPAVWADLGAGGGSFTRALATLLPRGSRLYTMDRVMHSLPSELLSGPIPVTTMLGDFTQAADVGRLPMVDGLLMANSLHFVTDQARALISICGRLCPGGRFILVEYVPDRVLPFVPHPIPFSAFVSLAKAVGLTEPVQIGMRQSPRTGIAMYAAVASRPTTELTGSAKRGF